MKTNPISQTWWYFVWAFTAQTETDEEALKDEMAQQYKMQLQQPMEDKQRPKQKKGIKRFFGKWVWMHTLSLRSV